jgi:hypothetical protein
VCVAFACATLVAIPSNGFGGLRSTGDAEKAWTAYTQAQRQWHQELVDLLFNRRPDLKEIILVNRDLQFALIERRSLEFRYLLAMHAERIVGDQGISRFANYDWTDKDASALRRSNPAYETATKHVEALQQRSDEHPQRPALREAYQALAEEADYQEMYGRFELRVKAAEKLLKENR